MSITLGHPASKETVDGEIGVHAAFREMGAVRPLARDAVSGSFPGKQTVKDAGKPENMGFSSYGFIPVSFVFQGQYDAVWGLLPVEKSSTTADTKPLNSVAPATSMAVVQARVLRFSQLRIRERVMRELPNVGVML